MHLLTEVLTYLSYSLMFAGALWLIIVRLRAGNRAGMGPIAALWVLLSGVAVQALRQLLTAIDDPSPLSIIGASVLATAVTFATTIMLGAQWRVRSAATGVMRRAFTPINPPVQVHVTRETAGWVATTAEATIRGRHLRDVIGRTQAAFGPVGHLSRWGDDRLEFNFELPDGATENWLKAGEALTGRRPLDYEEYTSRQRLTVTLMGDAGYSPAEISDFLGASPSWVRHELAPAK